MLGNIKQFCHPASVLVFFFAGESLKMETSETASKWTVVDKLVASGHLRSFTTLIKKRFYLWTAVLDAGL